MALSFETQVTAFALKVRIFQSIPRDADHPWIKKKFQSLIQPKILF